MMKLFVGFLSLLFLAYGLAGSAAADTFTQPNKKIVPIGKLKTRSVQVPPALPIDKNETIENIEKNVYVRFLQFLTLIPSTEMRDEARRRLTRLEVEARRYNSQLLNKESGKNARPISIQYQHVALLIEDLLRPFPEYLNENVLYLLASTYDEGDRPELMLVALNKLIKQFPHSEYTVEALFRRGEFLFSNGSYLQAGLSYQQVIESGKQTGFYLRALYKVSWALFKQEKYQQSLGWLMLAMDEQWQAANQKDKDDATELAKLAEGDYVKSLLDAISLNFSYLDGPRSVAEYFKMHGKRPYEYRIYEGLGQFYLSKKRYSDAANTFITFVKLYPQHQYTSALQQQAIATYQDARFADDLIKAKKDYANRYSLTGEYWGVVNGKGPDSQTLVFIKNNLKELAEYYHAAVQAGIKADKVKSKKYTENYEQAIYWYQEYIASFPEDKQTSGMHFLLAELFESNQEYSRAIEAYEKTAYRYEQHSRAADAGYSALLIYHDRILQPSKKPTVNWYLQSKSSTAKFVEHFPKDKRLARILVKSAEMAYQRKEWSLVSDYAQQVVVRPNTASILKQKAVALLANSYFEQANYAEAEKAYAQALVWIPPTSKLYKGLSERRAVTIYKQAEIKREQGDLKGAASDFARISRISAPLEIQATADYDFAAVMIAQKKWPAAIDSLLGFKKKYKAHKFSKEVNRKLAVAYMENKQAIKAAEVFQEVAHQADSKKENEIALQALWQAAELYGQEKMPVESVAAYRAFIKRNKVNVEQRFEARQKIVDLYSSLYGQENSQPQYRQALIDIVNAEKKLKASKKTDRIRYLAAMAALENAKIDYRSYSNIALELPLEKSFKRKKVSLQKTLSQLNDIVEYDIADATTAATFYAGELFSQLSKALLSSDRPANLSELEIEQYDILLEDQAFPLEDKAVSYYEVNAERISDEFYDEWIQKSMQQLAKLSPARYAKRERTEIYVE